MPAVGDEVLFKRLIKSTPDTSLKHRLVAFHSTQCGCSTAFAVDVTMLINFESSSRRRRREGFRIHASRLASLRYVRRTDEPSRQLCAYVRQTSALGTTGLVRVGTATSETTLWYLLFVFS